MAKKTVIIGASPNPSRYSYLAANLLVQHGHEIVPMGIKHGSVAGVEILDIRKKPEVKNVDTVTLYINPSRHPEWYDYIVGLKPRRIIFNPGTENDEFRHKVVASGIEPLEACTLVMLRTGQY